MNEARIDHDNNLNISKQSKQAVKHTWKYLQIQQQISHSALSVPLVLLPFVSHAYSSIYKAYIPMMCS